MERLTEREKAEIRLIADATYETTRSVLMKLTKRESKNRLGFQNVDASYMVF